LWRVAGTRVDIAYAKQACGRYSVDPGKQLWDAVIRKTRYLKDTAGYTVVYLRYIMADTISFNHNWFLGNSFFTHSELNLVTIFARSSNVSNWSLHQVCSLSTYVFTAYYRHTHH